MSLSFAELLLQDKESFIRELAQAARERAGPTYARESPEHLRMRMELVFDAAYQTLANDDPSIMEQFVHGSVRQRVQERYDVEEIQAFVSVLREALLGRLDAAYEQDPAAYRISVRQVEDLAHRMRLNAVEVYHRAYEEQMEMQQRALAELSTPVIKVYENVLVLPLVGAIDTDRSHRIMEDLLLGITRHQAEIVIIDITGVPLVDTAVANHLMQTIKAARLLGTRSILVGIRGEVAQALVHLQVNLTGVVTRSNLQAGIEYALEYMGLEIAPRSEDAAAEAAAPVPGA